MGMGVKEEYLVESRILHNNPECIEGCIDVLCEQWGRSKAARSSMLEKSCDRFPFNIALVEISGSHVEVIGHSRLCQVVGSPSSAFVESVVIKKSKRGGGMGRKLMIETEKHALDLGISTLYLTTTDMQDFYQHLGFEFCQPIVSLGSASKLLNTSGIQDVFGCKLTSHPLNKPVSPSNFLGSSTNCPPPPPPPPPPPLPFLPSIANQSSRVNKIWKDPSSGGKPEIIKVEVYWMMKTLPNV